MREGLKRIIDAQPDMEVVGEAPDGGVAVEAARRILPDVVVMDVSMPTVSGFDATRQLSEHCPDVKVLALTRYSDDAYLQQLLQAGAAGYVLKQSAASEMLQGIRAVAKGGNYIDAAIAGRLIRDYRRRPGVPADGGDLTPRETEILQLVAWGYSNKEIAARLNVSVKTVETHKANAMEKLGMRSRIDVVRYALVKGWLKDA